MAMFPSKRLLQLLPGFADDTEWFRFVRRLDQPVVDPNLFGFAVAALAQQEPDFAGIFKLWELEVFRLLLIVTTFSGDVISKQISTAFPRALTLAHSLRSALVDSGDLQGYVACIDRHVNSLRNEAGSHPLLESNMLTILAAATPTTD
eukprot:464457-Rhodomonas_salina.1